MRARISAIAALIVLFSTFCLGAEKHFSKQFTVQPGGTLRLETDAGSVQLVGTSSNQVSVSADINGSEKDVSHFEIVAEQTGSGVEVKGKDGRSHFWSWGSNDLDVSFTIEVPHNYNIRVETSGGDVKVKGVAGSVDGTTSGGNVEAKEIEGKTNLNTSGGNIAAENITGGVKVVTSGGNIYASGVTGDFEGWTSGGNVKVLDVDGKVRAQTSGGQVTVRLRKENKGVYAESSGGDIEIAMGKDVAADIDASTSGGEVVCDLPVTVQGHMDEGSIRGKVNGGGNAVRAHTSGGNIHIAALP